MLEFKKLLLSLLIIAILAITFGSVNSFATQIVANVSGNSNTSVGTSSISSNNIVTNRNTTNNVVNNTNVTRNNVVNRITNSSSYNTANTANATNNTKSSLPYAGTNSTIIFVLIALAISAVYAYKKVSDYNM